jgi:hypothetical protein
VVVVMVVMVMMVVPEDPAKRPRHNVVMVMMVVMIELSHLHLIGRINRRSLRQPCVVRLQGSDRVRNRIEKIPVTCSRRQLAPLRRRGCLSSSDGRQGSSRSEETGYLLIHISSESV